jgi:hypothetical protein
VTVTLHLPPALVSTLSSLGFDWPDSDEDKLEAMGRRWRAYAGTLSALVDEADREARSVWTTNEGFAIDAFKASWEGADAPIASLREGAVAATLIGDAFIFSAAAVLALKITVLGQVAAFARTLYLAAIAAKTPWTAAGAIAAVIAHRIIVQAAIDAAFELAIAELERG